MLVSVNSEPAAAAPGLACERVITGKALIVSRQRHTPRVDEIAVSKVGVALATPK